SDFRLPALQQELQSLLRGARPLMWKILRARLASGRATMEIPSDGRLPEGFRGRPHIDAARCREGCRECAEACPTGAILLDPPRIDLGACIFCPVCAEACPEGA